VKAALAAWREMQKSLDPQRLVFIDETWVRGGVSFFATAFTGLGSRRNTGISLGLWTLTNRIRKKSKKKRGACFNKPAPMF
jgi:hypothetical protein